MGGNNFRSLKENLSAFCKRKMKVAQLCLTLCDPMDYTVHGVLQARILEWVVIPFPRGLTQGLNLCLLHCRQTLYQGVLAYNFIVCTKQARI